MAIIDYTYFQKAPVIVPNIATTPAPYAARLAELNQYILIYEEEFLRLLWGDDLYDAYVATPSAARFTALIAKLRDSTNKVSPIANYVYIRYQQDHQQVVTSSGDKETTNAGMTSAVNVQMYSNIINHMVSMAERVYDYMADNSATYPEWQCDFAFQKTYLFGI